MKKIILITSLFMTNTNFLSAQSNPANNNAKTGPIARFQNVKTQTVNVGGIDFYYRKLGENNPGVPVIFVNHLAATMDNCDPRIMDGIASQRQIIAFDNRGVQRF